MLAEILDLTITESDVVGGPALVIRSTRIENVERFFRQQAREFFGEETLHLRPVREVLGSIGTIVRQDKLNIAAETQCPIRGQTADGSKIVGLQSQAVIIEVLDGCVFDDELAAIQRHARFYTRCQYAFTTLGLCRIFAAMSRSCSSGSPKTST
jgi:hypothetical protein